MDDRQRFAAQLVASGLGSEAAAQRVGVSPATVRRWRRRLDFRQAVARQQDPSVRGTLEAALQATLKDGRPDWRTRVQAARALAELPADDARDERPTAVATLYRAPPGDDG